jgi:hypothetical protein
MDRAAKLERISSKKLIFKTLFNIKKLLKVGGQQQIKTAFRSPQTNRNMIFIKWDSPDKKIADLKLFFLRES